MGELDIETPTNNKVKRVVRRRVHAFLYVTDVYVCVGMRPAEQCFRERLKATVAEFDHGTYVVGEEVGRDVRFCLGHKSRLAAIALKFGLDPDEIGEEIRESAAAAVQ